MLTAVAFVKKDNSRHNRNVNDPQTRRAIETETRVSPHSVIYSPAATATERSEVIARTNRTENAVVRGDAVFPRDRATRHRALKGII